MITQQSDVETLDRILRDFSQRPVPLAADGRLVEALRACLEAGQGRLPLPGQGQTLQRWQALARVAGIDLALVKLYEGHTDAQAILTELGASGIDRDGIWGVWAAEPPGARVVLQSRSGAQVRLQGTKAWCSGAPQIDQALLTAWDGQGRSQLVAVRLDQPGVTLTGDGWHAIGMAATASVDVHFQGALGQCVGPAQGYLQRPGFWHGGAGIAACWFGAAEALAEYLRRACRHRPDPHGEAHLGAVDAALHGAAGALRDCAAWIDKHPAEDAQCRVRRVRAQVEAAVSQVQWHVGRALGATPFCRDAHFARLSADLPVFIRQSHAERDLAGLGRVVAAERDGSWRL